MDVLNLGNMKKKSQTGAMAVPPTVKNSMTNHAFTNGKSRVQGTKGAMQGNEGWKSQYKPTATQGYGKQMNPIIGKLSQSVKYETPQIKDSLLTGKGFNQALGVVGARNKAKLDMQNRQVLKGVLGSLMDGENATRANQNRVDVTKMNNTSNETIQQNRNATIERGQDLNNTNNMENREVKKDYNSTMGDYYDGQVEIGKERNNLTREGMNNPKQKTMHPLDAKIKRQKLLNDGGLENLIGEADLSDEQMQSVKSRYITTGELPTVSKGEASMFGFGGDSTLSYGDEAQTPTQTPQAQTPTQPTQTPKTEPRATGTILKGLSKQLGVDRSDLKISDDGASITFPDGSTVALSELS